MDTIRRILLTEYIGAILIAVLVADAFSALITTAVAQISYYARLRHDPYFSTHRFSTTYSLFEASARIALYLLVAYLIARWLYPAKSSTAVHNEQAGAQ
jgi:hypothetical protein